MTTEEILAQILKELQTMNKKLDEANGHLSQIAYKWTSILSFFV